MTNRIWYFGIQLVGLLSGMFLFSAQEKIALFAAARRGSLNTLRELIINKQVEVNQYDDFGHSPLFYASENGKDKAVQFLMHYGAKISAETDNQTPLHSAKSIRVVKKILRAAKNVSAKLTLLGAPDSTGQTLLHKAALLRKKSMVEYLLQRGANSHAKDQAGRIPFHYAIDNDDADSMKLLLKYDYKVIHDRTPEGKLPLYHAVARNCLSATNVLLSHDAQLDENDPRGKKLVELAILDQNNNDEKQYREGIFTLLLAHFPSLDLDQFYQNFINKNIILSAGFSYTMRERRADEIINVIQPMFLFPDAHKTDRPPLPAEVVDQISSYVCAFLVPDCCSPRHKKRIMVNIDKKRIN